NRDVIPLPSHEGRYPSAVREGDDCLCLRQHHRDALDPQDHPRRDLLRLPPVLHRQAEAGRHGWPGGTLPAQVRPPQRERRHVGVTCPPAARRGRARQGPRPRWPDMTMLDRLAEIERHYEELERLVSDPAVLADRRRYVALAKERAQLEETVT